MTKDVAQNPPPAKYLIYGLVDPRSLLVRYIGRSSNGLKRPARHQDKRALAANTRCATWIKSLLNAGILYQVVVLEVLAVRDQLKEAERWWIAYGHLSQWPLTNHTLGGDGMLGCSPSLESRKRRSEKLKGRVFSDTHRAKLSAAKRGVPKSEEHKHQLSKAVTLLWQDPELRQRQRASHLGNRHTPEQKAKLSASHKGKKRSAEARANLSAGQTKYNQRLREAGIQHPQAAKSRSPEVLEKIATRVKQRTCCKAGHPYTEESVYMRTVLGRRNPMRVCRPCQNARLLQKKLQRKAVP